MFKKIVNKVKGVMRNERVQAFCMMLVMGSAIAFAQNAAGKFDAGTTALGTATTEIAKYVPAVIKLCYALAGVVAVVGSISVYLKINCDNASNQLIIN